MAIVMFGIVYGFLLPEAKIRFCGVVAQYQYMLASPVAAEVNAAVPPSMTFNVAGGCCVITGTVSTVSEKGLVTTSPALLVNNARY